MRARAQRLHLADIYPYLPRSPQGSGLTKQALNPCLFKGRYPLALLAFGLGPRFPCLLDTAMAILQLPFVRLQNAFAVRRLTHHDEIDDNCWRVGSSSEVATLLVLLRSF